MNIVLDRSAGNIIFINGATAEGGEGPTIPSLEDRVGAVLEDLGTAFDPFKAYAHIRRLETLLKREATETEIVNQIVYVARVEVEYAELTAVLVGAGDLVPQRDGQDPVYCPRSDTAFRDYLLTTYLKAERISA